MLKLISIVIFLSVIFVAGSLNPVYAITTTISDKTSCEGIGGSWTTTPDTCTLSASYTVIAGDELIINSGVTLVFDPGLDLTNHGSITNNGIIILTGDGTNASGSIFNKDSSSFTNAGTLSLTGGAGSDTGSLRIHDNSEFTNSGIVIITGNSGNLSGFLSLQDSGKFTNSGSFTLTGGSGRASGIFDNWDSASVVNTGTITIIGSTGIQSGIITNMGKSSFKNDGMLSITGGSGKNSGFLENSASANFENLKTITITSGTGIMNIGNLRIVDKSIFKNSGTVTIPTDLKNENLITNFGTITVANDLSNRGIIKNCGTVTVTGILIGNGLVKCGSSSTAREDPTIGKTSFGIQVVLNGICIDITCWTVTADYHQDFELVEMLSDSTHTISTTVYCHNGVEKCNYVAFGVSPYGTNINDSVWKVVLQKDHRNNWSMTVIDPDGYLGDVTSTTQIVNDGKNLAASMHALFKKPTAGMILNIETRDTYGGYRDFQFNDGIAIKDAYAYPVIATSYEELIEQKPLCNNENSNKRYTCAFDKVREWTIKNAEAKLQQIMNE